MLIKHKIHNTPDIPVFRFVMEESLRNSLASACSRVIDSRQFIFGNEVLQFEKEFSDYCGVSTCVTVANGSDALLLALRAVGVNTGDKVHLVANAGFYGSAAVREIGAIPVYLDVDEDSQNLSPVEVGNTINKNPKAIIVTHLYGHLANIEEIVKIAQNKSVPVIEDCAQGHGAMRDGKYAGCFGTAACFSFYPTKNLGAFGDAGAVITNNPEIALKLQKLRQYGWGSKYHIEIPGGRNSRLDEMQAVVLREKLPYLDRWNEERRKIARQYNEAFSGLSVRCPPSLSEDYVAHLYVLRVKHRSKFRKFFTNKGIATDVHYPIPDHLQPAYQCEQIAGSLPVTEEACNSVVTLPCFPGMTDAEISRVIEAVVAWDQECCH